MSAERAPVYRTDPAPLRLAVVREGMTLLYHRPSGITHVLLPPAPEILDALAAGPADAATVAARLEAAHGPAEREDAAPVIDIVTARLRELVETGLVAEA